MGIYQLLISLVDRLLHIVWNSPRLQHYLFTHRPKVYKVVMGQRELLDHIAATMAREQREVYWLHASSYGEYNVIRPVAQRLRTAERAVVITFFSSTGYEMLQAKNKHGEEADYVFYLPLDKKCYVRRFLDSVKPQRAVFAISEYWMNYLNELQRRKIPAFVVSMSVPESSYLLKWYGYPIRKALNAMQTMMVLDEGSKERLQQVGFCNVVVTGDPLFDNAVAIAREDYHHPVVERFAKTTNGLLVAGSINDERDVALVTQLVNRHSERKWLIVPHELKDQCICSIEQRLTVKSLRSSQCDDQTLLDDVQVLIVDELGQLARLYRYGRWAYVGGGFTPYLHSVIEPVVYGMPVVYGPRLERKPVAREMARMGIGGVVETPEELEQWWTAMEDDHRLKRLQQQALQYAQRQAGATDRVVEILLSGTARKEVVG